MGVPKSKCGVFGFSGHLLKLRKTHLVRLISEPDRACGRYHRHHIATNPPHPCISYPPASNTKAAGVTVKLPGSAHNLLLHGRASHIEHRVPKTRSQMVGYGMEKLHEKS